MEELAAPPAADEIERQARAAYEEGAFERSVAAWERLYELGRASGDDATAARGAAMVALFLLIEAALLSTVRGWLTRSRRHLDNVPEGETHAIWAMVAAYERFFSGDAERARECAAEAVRLGTVHGVVSAQVFGTVASARIQIAAGEYAAGLGRLDQIGTFLLAGGADPLTTGMVYGELICSRGG